LKSSECPKKQSYLEETQKKLSNYKNDTKVDLVNEEENKEKLIVASLAPAPPPLPVHLFTSNANCLFNSCEKINCVKNINWEKIENRNLVGTFWEKVRKTLNKLTSILYL
jgi:hypothetical protein